MCASSAEATGEESPNLTPVSSDIVHRPFVHDLALVSGAEAAVIVSGISVISILGRVLGAAALGEYLLVRRIVSLLQTGVQLGLPLALARQVPFASRRPGNLSSYLLSALGSGGLLALIGFGVLLATPKLYARWLLGETSRAYLIAPLGLLLVGMVVHASVYGFYRGQLAMKRASELQGLSLAVVPLACVAGLSWTRSVAVIVAVMGACTLLVAVTFAFPHLRSWSNSLKCKLVTERTRELLRYGVPRVPGDLGLAALVALGPILAAHVLSLEDVSAFLLGQSLVLLVGSAAAPLNLVLVPKLSMMLAQDQVSEVRRGLCHLIIAATHLSVYGVLQLIVFVDVLLRVWVGPEFGLKVGVVRLLLLAAPFYLFYTVLRGTVDAASVTAYNTRHVLISVMVFFSLAVGLVQVLPSDLLLFGLSGALVLSFLILALLTARVIQHLYGNCVLATELGFGVLAACLCGAGAQVSRELSPWSSNLVGAFLIEVALSLFFFWLLWKRRTPWVLLFLEVVRSISTRDWAAHPNRIGKS